MPDFKAVGFLGSELSQFRENVRAKHAPTFKVADALNTVAMRILWDLPLTALDETKAYAVMCFARAVQSFQCAILMCERGAMAEARTLIRAMAESVFLTYGMCKKQDMLARLEEDHANHWRADANSRIEIGKRKGKDVSRFQEMVADIDATYPNGPWPIKWGSLASEMGLDLLYQIAYRQPSGDAAHTTLDALHRHAEIDAEGDLYSFIFSPGDIDLAPTLKAAMAGIAQLISLAVYDMGMTSYEDEVKNVLLEWRCYLGD